MLLLTLSLAFADALGPEPENCPNGSIGTSSHAGEWCAPADCSADDECTEGGCVADVGLCIVESEESCGGWNPDTGEECTFTKREVLDKCSTQDDCSEGTCEIADRCATPGVAEACGCSTGLQGWVAGLMGAFVLLMARVR